VPASLLVNLPTLPGAAAIPNHREASHLLDEDADVIVDYALNIIR
jgi:hypothetical protein